MNKSRFAKRRFGQPGASAAAVQPAAESRSADGHASGAIRVALACRRRLDLAAYSSLLRNAPLISLAAADADLSDSESHCRRLRPDAALFDVGFPGRKSFCVAESLLAEGVVSVALLLDDHFAIARAEKSLSIPGCIYLTREDDLVQILADAAGRRKAVTQARGQAIISVDAHKFCYASERSELRLLDADGILDLTPREREIFELMLVGISVREIAERLGLTESTADNHKTSLMKKLNVTKQTQIAGIALRAGLLNSP